jgi:amino acid permease
MERTFSSLEPGSVRGSVFTLASTAIGAGVLSLPLVLKNCGLVLGLVLVNYISHLSVPFHMIIFDEIANVKGW